MESNPYKSPQSRAGNSPRPPINKRRRALIIAVAVVGALALLIILVLPLIILKLDDAQTEWERTHHINDSRAIEQPQK